jgi:hypothetical protein
VTMWSVQVEINDLGPRMLTVDQSTAADALALTKAQVREMLMGLPPGGSEYTVSVFAPGFRVGDQSLCAERVSMVTMEPA